MKYTAHMHSSFASTTSNDQTPITASAVDLLVQQIKTYIQENHLAIGDALPSERVLGEQFKAARNTVREAIGILKAYGVVEVRPKVGAVIVNRHTDAVLDLFSFHIRLSPETFRDIQGFRRLIEVGSVDRIFVNFTPENLSELHRINAQMLAASSPLEAAQRDFTFHALLLNIAENTTVLSVYNTLKPMITRLMETGKHIAHQKDLAGKKGNKDGLRQTYRQHQDILNALQKRDRLAYQYIMSAHLDQGLNYIDGAVDLGPTTV